MSHTGVRNKEWSSWKDTGQKISMGERVGAILTNLRETACIHIEQREIIAYMKMYALLMPHDTQMLVFFKNCGIPALKELGYAKWYRDVITDLAMVLGKGTKNTSRTDEKFNQKLLTE